MDQPVPIQGNQTDRIFAQQADLDLFKPESKQSHSIACGDDNIACATQATDARDMVKDLGTQKVQNSFGCNTDGPNTHDKDVGVMIDTNESASQCKTMSKDAMCDTKIITESIACQKDSIGNEKMVSCLILRPEDLVGQEVAGNLEDLPECFKCDGKMVNKNGLPCKKCNGTGKINNKFFKDLQKILNNEVKAYCTQEYQKLLTTHL